MKYLLALLLLTFSTLSFSEAIILGSTSIQDLNLDQSEVEISIMYPGPHLSGICGVEIRSNSYISEVKKLINIKKSWDIVPVVRTVHDSIILIDLTEAADSYVTTFKISTKDGRTFKDNFAAMLVHGEKIMLVTRTCP